MMMWKRMCVTMLAVAASATLADASDKHDKVVLDLDTAGIVKLRPECSSAGSALEVEVELKDGLPDGECFVTVDAGTVSADLGSFLTDDEGEGETKADIDLEGQMGEVTVTVTVECTGVDPVTGEAIAETLTVTQTFTIECDIEEEEEEEI